MEKEDSYHQLELEVEDLRRKNKTHIKLIDSSTILDKILDSLRPSNDKSGLGYNRTDEESEACEWTYDYKRDISSSFIKGKGDAIYQEHTQRVTQEEHQ